MIGITVIETAFFLYHSIHLSTVHNIPITMDGPVPYCSMLIYNPHRRWEAWRFFTYMFVHIGKDFRNLLKRYENNTLWQNPAKIK